MYSLRTPRYYISRSPSAGTPRSAHTMLPLVPTRLTARLMGAWVVLLWMASRWVCAAEPPGADSSVQRLDEPSAASDAPPVEKRHLIFEVTGKLLWPNGQKTGETPVHIESTQTFYERVHLPRHRSDARSTWAIRYYEAARADYRIGGTTRQQLLSPSHRLVILDFTAEGLRAYSPYEPLSREELDLLDVPCCTLVLQELFPKEEQTRDGQSWPLEAATVRRLLGLSEVTHHTVHGRWLRNEQDVSVVEFRGVVEGKAEGAATRIDWTAKANVGIHDHHVRWFAMTLHEQRQMSESAPGLDVHAKLRLASVIVPHTAEPTPLGDVPAMPIAPQAVPLVRTTGPDQKWSVLHDNRWVLIVARHDVTILRLFDKGTLLGQVIITTLPDAPAGRQLSSATFQQEILQVLREHQGRILETSEGENDRGVRVLRAEAIGVVGDTSMQWTFYHLSDAWGRRAALCFTVESDKREQFEERDRVFVETFAFRPPPQAETNEGVERPVTPETMPPTEDATGASAENQPPASDSAAHQIRPSP